MSFDIKKVLPNFITPDDYKDYWGHDLREDFLDSDNPSMAANMFLFRVESILKMQIDKYTFRKYERNSLTPRQNDYFCLAMLEQAHYMWRNGDILSDSGYDPDRGIIADPGNLRAISISPLAIDYLINGGLWSHNIKPTRRTGGFWKGIF